MQEAHECDELTQARRGLSGERGHGSCPITVLAMYPDIGDKIEKICDDLRIGADASRRDGYCTMNSSVKKRKGTGFVRIRLELEMRHGIELSSRALKVNL